MKNHVTQHRELDHPASNKALMTTPPMTRQQHEQIRKQQRNTRRLIEEANDARELRRATSVYSA
ncbi:MAG: hypothetical protein EOP14_00635 [Pseudomonas sp.]|jgi:hypothetical protein|nr:MAG: hypothetical protein EOP14_00635 [Pseudomonas sp.]